MAGAVAPGGHVAGEGRIAGHDRYSLAVFDLVDLGLELHDRAGALQAAGVDLAHDLRPAAVAAADSPPWPEFAAFAESPSAAPGLPSPEARGLPVSLVTSLRTGSSPPIMPVTALYGLVPAGEVPATGNHFAQESGRQYSHAVAIGHVFFFFFFVCLLVQVWSCSPTPPGSFVGILPPPG